MKRLFTLLLPIFTLLQPLAAEQIPQIDTTIVVDQVSVTAIKQGLKLYREPIAASVISKESAERRGVVAIKDVAQIAPNLHIPDYGSRTTSSIYIRGLGARIDQPVMGLNIDNVPYLNKNAFDMEVMDIERVEILRGPQSTLYGRNTMGGVINIYTTSPFSYQGTKLSGEYSSGNSYRIKASNYGKFSDKVAYSAALYMNSSDGLFENSYTNEKCDEEKSYGTRFKVGYRASEKLRIENTLSASLLDQGGYPYKHLLLGEISYNDPSQYDRLSISNGTTIKYEGNGYTLASITGYQYLNDEMILDNDFTKESYFTLSQAIQENSITEDVVLKSSMGEQYNFLFGAFGFFKRQAMQAPVTFKERGIENLILKNANAQFDGDFVWNEPSFALGSDFVNNTFGGALYHESNYEWERWRATIGVRLDFEQALLNYHNFTNTSCTYVTDKDKILKEIDINIRNNESRSFLEFLPKFSLLYRLGESLQSSIYSSITKGYKAGGFNTQMFSDILQQRLMKEFGVSMGESYDTGDVIAYRPEHSWNYEVGGHFESKDRSVLSDIAIFYIDCRDQQLTVFPKGETTGRMMTNAGRSRSYGAEVSVSAQISERLQSNVSYGYTNAKFTHYTSGDSNYAGNWVPYSPQHTIFAELSYTLPINRDWGEALGFDINTKGVGPIYWNEDNSRREEFYSLLNASIRLQHHNYTLALWGKNLTNKEYDIFYFKSMGNEFTQSGRPLTLGVTLTINL